MKKNKKISWLILSIITFISSAFIIPVAAISVLAHDVRSSSSVQTQDAQSTFKYNDFPIANSNYVVNFSQDNVTVYSTEGNLVYKLSISDFFLHEKKNLNQINKVLLVHDKLFVVASYFENNNSNFGSVMSVFDLKKAKVVFEDILSYQGESLNNVFNLGNNRVLLTNFQMKIGDIFTFHKAKVMDLNKLDKNEPAITNFNSTLKNANGQINQNDYLLDLFFHNNNYYLITLDNSSSNPGRAYISSFNQSDWTYNSPERQISVWDLEGYQAANAKYMEENAKYKQQSEELKNDSEGLKKLVQPTKPDANKFHSYKNVSSPLAISLSTWMQAVGSAKYTPTPYTWPQNNYYFSDNNTLILYLTNQTTINSKTIAILNLKTFQYEIDPNNFLQFNLQDVQHGNKWKLDEATKKLFKDTKDSERVDLRITSVVKIEKKIYFTLFSRSLKINDLLKDKVFYFDSATTDKNFWTISFYTLKNTESNFSFFRGQLVQKINDQQLWYLNESNQKTYLINFKDVSANSVQITKTDQSQEQFTFLNLSSALLVPNTTFASSAIKLLKNSQTQLYQIKDSNVKLLSIVFSADDIQGLVRVVATIQNSQTKQNYQIGHTYRNFKTIDKIQPSFSNEFNPNFFSNLENKNYALVNLLPSEVTVKMLQEKQIVVLTDPKNQSIQLVSDDKNGQLTINVHDRQNSEEVLRNPKLFSKNYDIFLSSKINFRWLLNPEVLSAVKQKQADDIDLADFGPKPYIVSGYEIQDPLKLLKISDKQIQLSITLSQNKKMTKFNYNIELNPENARATKTTQSASTAIIAGSVSASILIIGIGLFSWWFIKIKPKKNKKP